ncbi:hypothetical protein GGTG_10777 [Gaeumannomyces tritici R3-111a-1]|uniref:Uncharacterized protein n=1 Tax=Gaeumannomyces tritici (strain R3-111a-1) TaxID=644352 RepID=J3PBA4_GAET3|nr:hypothetical protein GGTG_10777 [Gaeumannomyces tritici R3-111a-1]EJT71520.1 hypothetical protein GGTG_10777 [Gaeumannomyces tritici R3-111a-1]
MGSRLGKDGRDRQAARVGTGYWFAASKAGYLSTLILGRGRNRACRAAQPQAQSKSQPSQELVAAPPTGMVCPGGG